MCLSVLLVFMDAYHVLAWNLQSSKGSLDALELELGMVVYHGVSAGSQASCALNR